MERKLEQLVEVLEQTRDFYERMLTLILEEKAGSYRLPISNDSAGSVKKKKAWLPSSNRPSSAATPSCTPLRRHSTSHCNN